MTLLESRLGQTERRIEREMTQIHAKMDDVFRNLPDKSYVPFICLHTVSLSMEPCILIPLPFSLSLQSRFAREGD